MMAWPDALTSPGPAARSRDVREGDDGGPRYPHPSTCRHSARARVQPASLYHDRRVPVGGGGPNLRVFRPSFHRSGLGSGCGCFRRSTNRASVRPSQGVTPDLVDRTSDTAIRLSDTRNETGWNERSGEAKTRRCQHWTAAQLKSMKGKAQTGSHQTRASVRINGVGAVNPSSPPRSMPPGQQQDRVHAEGRVDLIILAHQQAVQLVDGPVTRSARLLGNHLRRGQDRV